MVVEIEDTDHVHRESLPPGRLGHTSTVRRRSAVDRRGRRLDTTYHGVMSIDMAAFVRALQDDPAQRAALRDALGIDDLDIRGALDELAQAQARTEARVEQLAQAQARTEARVDELAKAQLRTEVRVEELAQAVNGLLDVAAGMHDRLGRLDGADLERRYRERGPAYLLRLARRLRLIDSATLAEMVDDGQTAGLLSDLEGGSLMVADAVFSGQRRDDRERVHLVVEVSVSVARHDVRRARERADLLARIVDTPVIAVVAGDHAPGAVAQAAQDADVWSVTRGQVVSPGDDLDV